MRAALLLCIATLTATSAFAQTAAPDAGVVVNKSAAGAKADKVEQATDAFFKCIVDHDPANARVVVLRPDAAATVKAGKKLTQLASECLGQQDGLKLTTNYLLYSGGMARALYLRSNPGRPEKVTSAPAIAPTPVKLESTTPGGQAIEAMGIFADCVIANASNVADAFVRANPGSGAETSALGELKPIMPNCLTTSDKLALSRQSLRAGLSIALYKQYAAATVLVEAK